MSLLPVFPRLENLLGACLSHECVGSFLALFSCLNFNFLSAWAQFWELKRIEPCPRGGEAPNSSSALNFVLAWELSASCSQEQWQCLRINLLGFFSTTTSQGQLVFTLVLFYLSLLSQGGDKDCLCFVWDSVGSHEKLAHCTSHPLRALSRSITECCGQDKHTLQLSQKGVKPPWLLNLLLPIMTCAFLQRFVMCVILHLEKDWACWSCKLPWSQETGAYVSVRWSVRCYFIWKA